MWHGILIIDKERGLTSHQVVANLRRILGQKEIGHTGTLDPEATGVLVVGLGQATRSFPFLNEASKVYHAEIVLGRQTDTQDATGTVLKEDRELQITGAELNKAIAQLTGTVNQVPPMFSAVKIKGQKLYELARQGLEVERESRQIRVFNWRLEEERQQYHFNDRIMVEITCSKGTYIRTLINDLGEILGCGAHMGKLVRLRSGDFTLEDAVQVDQVKKLLSEGRLTEHLISINTALYHLPPIYPVDEDLAKVIHGGKISYHKYKHPVAPGSYARILDHRSRVIAIAQYQENDSNQYWQPIKVFSYTG